MKKLLSMSLLAGLALLAWRFTHSNPAASDGGDPRLVYDRLWIDHLPRNDRDTAQLFAVLSEEPLGAFESRSAWQGAWEFFRYQASDDGRFDLRFPQRGKRELTRVRATRCQERDFDYCLVIQRGDGKQFRYYSRKGWEIGNATNAAGLRDQIGHVAAFATGENQAVSR